MLCIIWTGAIINVIHCFGNNKVRVCIALSVRMRDHIYRDAVNAYGNVSAVIAIKTAQKYLFSFAAARVLCHEQACHKAHKLLGILHGLQVKINLGYVGKFLLDVCLREHNIIQFYFCGTQRDEHIIDWAY